MIAATMFSGIGAPECAMPHWDWRWCAEIEKFPSAVLKARHPKSVNLGDINAEDFIARAEGVAGRPDIIVFGSPCQDFSVAGRRVGLDGDRGNLALVAFGVVKRLRPRWVAFENVPGLLSSRSGSAEVVRALRDRGVRGGPDAGPSDGGIGSRADFEEDSDFAAFLALVQQCGYFGAYRITDAQFAGVPQRRRRIFAVFYLGDWRPAAAVLFEPESLRGDYPPSRETGEGVAGTISSRPSGGGGLGTDFDLDGGLDESAVEGARLPLPGVRGAERSDMVADVRMVQPREHNPERSRLNPDGPVGAVSAKWSKGSGGPAGDECYNLVTSLVSFNNTGQGWSKDADVAEGLRDMSAGGGSREATLIATMVTAFEDRTRGDDGRGYDRNPNFLEDVSPSLNTVKAPVVAFSSKDYGGDAAIEQSPTLRTMEFDASHANGGGQVAVAFQTRIARNGRGSESDVDPALNGADAGTTSDMRPCVAIFKPSHFTRGKDGAPSGVSPPLGAESDKGDQDPILMTETAVRRLTPRECERLQAFEDDYTLIHYRGAPAADGPRYKALGNAMNVREIQWVLQRIERFEKERASW